MLPKYKIQIHIGTTNCFATPNQSASASSTVLVADFLGFLEFPGAKEEGSQDGMYGFHNAVGVVLAADQLRCAALLLLMRMAR